MRAALKWKNEPLIGFDKDNQSALLTLRHPSFTKDVTFKGIIYRSPIDLLKTKVVVEYCDEPEHLLTFGAGFKDQTTIVGYRNYSFEMFGIHDASELDFDVRGSVGARSGIYETLTKGRYKRGYLPLQDGELLGLVNIHNKEVHFFVSFSH